MSKYSISTKKILTAVLRLQSTQEIEDVSIDTTVNWDSMSHLSIITGLENEFDIFIEVSDVEKLRSYKDIVEFLSQHPEL